jgi:hypothetical protein
VKRDQRVVKDRIASVLTSRLLQVLLLDEHVFFRVSHRTLEEALPQRTSNRNGE